MKLGIIEEFPNTKHIFIKLYNENMFVYVLNTHICRRVGMFMIVQYVAHCAKNFQVSKILHLSLKVYSNLKRTHSLFDRKTRPRTN